MKKSKPDFSKQQKSNDFYDLYEDWDLIEASFAQQYGIRLRHEEYMPWGEFSNLLAGLNYKTPLGSIISIRSETDSEKLKHFTPEQREIRDEWRTRWVQKQDPVDTKKQIEQLQAALKAAFS